MKDFINFLCKKTFVKPSNDIFDKQITQYALASTIQDVQFHFPELNGTDITNRIFSNCNELVIFLYRLGSGIWQKNKQSDSLRVIHWLMRELCGAEIYYSCQIDEGFYIVHGIGTIIAAEVKIGKGFTIYSNSVVMRDCLIGSNVKMYTGSLVKNNLEIGDHVTIGANTVITKNVPNNIIIYGNPNIVRPND